MVQLDNLMSKNWGWNIYQALIFSSAIGHSFCGVGWSGYFKYSSPIEESFY